VHIEIEPRVDPQRSKRRRQEVSRSRRDARQRVAMAPVVAGREADDGGRWAVRRIMAMRRHDGRRGRPLDVLVEWEGEDSDGDMWEESWVSVSYLSADLRADARRLEAELFGPRAAQAGPASRRATRRVAARQRQERERDVQPWRQAVQIAVGRCDTQSESRRVSESRGDPRESRRGIAPILHLVRSDLQERSPSFLIVNGGTHAEGRATGPTPLWEKRGGVNFTRPCAPPPIVDTSALEPRASVD